MEVEKSAQDKAAIEKTSPRRAETRGLDKTNLRRPDPVFRRRALTIWRLWGTQSAPAMAEKFQFRQLAARLYR